MIINQAVCLVEDLQIIVCPVNSVSNYQFVIHLLEVKHGVQSSQPHFMLYIVWLVFVCLANKLPHKVQHKFYAVNSFDSKSSSFLAYASVIMHTDVWYVLDTLLRCSQCFTDVLVLAVMVEWVCRHNYVFLGLLILFTPPYLPPWSITESFRQVFINLFEIKRTLCDIGWSYITANWAHFSSITRIILWKRYTGRFISVVV